jgi:hypothetical protein
LPPWLPPTTWPQGSRERSGRSRGWWAGNWGVAGADCGEIGGGLVRDGQSGTRVVVAWLLFKWWDQRLTGAVRCGAGVGRFVCSGTSAVGCCLRLWILDLAPQPMSL